MEKSNINLTKRPQSSQNSSMNQELQKYMNYKLELVRKQLKLTEQRINTEIQGEISTQINSSNIQNKNDMLNVSIPFCDKLNSLMTTLARVPASKSALFTINDLLKSKLTQRRVLDKQKRKSAKKDFDVICNYKKRKEDQLNNTGHFYAQNENLCYYLIDKCFKKTSSGVWDSFLRFNLDERFNLPQNKEISVCGVGGGPASDVMGTVSFLIDHFSKKNEGQIPKFKTCVLDYSDKMWAQTSKEIVTETAHETLKEFFKLKKESIKEHFSLDFDHIDFTSVETIKKEPVQKVLKSAHFVTICWALNEAEMVPDFWKVFFEITSRAFVIFIDGKGDKIQILKELYEREYMESQGGVLLIELLENPRRLIKIPK